jgi:hypothetical protein
MTRTSHMIQVRQTRIHGVHAAVAAGSQMYGRMNATFPPTAALYCILAPKWRAVEVWLLRSLKVLRPDLVLLARSHEAASQVVSAAATAPPSGVLPCP